MSNVLNGDIKTYVQQLIAGKMGTQALQGSRLESAEKSGHPQDLQQKNETPDQAESLQNSNTHSHNRKVGK